MKIACENTHGCQGSMTVLCPDSSWQRSGRRDKISARRREFLKDCSQAALLQNKEKGELEIMAELSQQTFAEVSHEAAAVL